MFNPATDTDELIDGRARGLGRQWLDAGNRLGTDEDVPADAFS